MQRKAFSGSNGWTQIKHESLKLDLQTLAQLYQKHKQAGQK